MLDIVLRNIPTRLSIKTSGYKEDRVFTYSSQAASPFGLGLLNHNRNFAVGSLSGSAWHHPVNRLSH